MNTALAIVAVFLAALNLVVAMHYIAGRRVAFALWHFGVAALMIYMLS